MNSMLLFATERATSPFYGRRTRRSRASRIVCSSNFLCDPLGQVTLTRTPSFDKSVNIYSAETHWSFQLFPSRLNIIRVICHSDSSTCRIISGHGENEIKNIGDFRLGEMLKLSIRELSVSRSAILVRVAKEDKSQLRARARARADSERAVENNRNVADDGFEPWHINRRLIRSRLVPTWYPK